MQQLYTWADAWNEWLVGGTFPVAFFGDSTVDGSTTTDWIPNEPGRASRSPHAFSAVLERLLREAAGNAAPRIYNAGFSGKTASWAAGKLEEVFGASSDYQDVRMIGIGFGINDRLEYADAKAYREGFRTHIETIIAWCFERSIQPFLLTTQASVEPGVHSSYTDMYPLRTSERIETTANVVKRELAAQYGLPLVDVNRHTESFLRHSAFSLPEIIADRLHFGDTGHRFEAALLFAALCPRTIVVDRPAQIDYLSQKLADAVPEDWLTMPTVPSDRFKLFVDRDKEREGDIPLLTAWVFVCSEKPLHLKACISGGDSSSTYVRVNGELTALTGTETDLGRLDWGLYKLEARSGTASRADFKGFVLE